MGGERGGGGEEEVGVISEDTSPRNPVLVSEEEVTKIVVPERRTTGSVLSLNSHLKTSGLFVTPTPIHTATAKLMPIRGESHSLLSLPGQAPINKVVTTTTTSIRPMLLPIGAAGRGQVLKNAANSVLNTASTGSGALYSHPSVPGLLVKLPIGVPLPQPPRGPDKGQA